MAGYIEVNSKLKNTIVLKAFSLSFLFVLVFAVTYYLGGGVISDLSLPERGGFLTVWGPVSIIAIVASLICCLPMIGLQDKILVPAGFLFLVIYYLIVLIVFLFSGDSADRPMIMQLVNLYFLPPVLFGNLIGWGAYLLWQRNRRRRYCHNDLTQQNKPAR